MNFNILFPAIGYKINDLWNRHYKHNQQQKSTVHVVGNGWGAYHFVKSLDKTKYSPVIIAPNSQVLDTPKLTELVIDPYSQVQFDNPYSDEFILDSVEDIDIVNKQLILKSGSKVKYDIVVLSIGSEPNDFGIQGVDDYTFKLKTIEDANKLRSQLNNIQKIYIVGSGVTGIELGSKLNNFGHEIKIIEGLDSILTGYNSNTKTQIYEKIILDYKNIDIFLNTMIKSIDSGNIQALNTLDKSSIQLPLNMNLELIIWTGGVRFCGYNKTPLFNTLNSISPIKPRGISVNPNFTIGSNPDIYCIGDMVANAGPPSAQNARLHAQWLAKYFNSNFDPNYPITNKFESNITTKLIHLDNETWLESPNYSGYIPKFINGIIEWFGK